VSSDLQLGGATARIGDPSGQYLDRQSLDTETVERNVAGIRENIERIASHHQQYFASGQKSRTSPLT